MTRKILFLFMTSGLLMTMANCANPEKTLTKNAVADSLTKENEKFQLCGELAENRTNEAPNGRIILSWDIDKFGYAKNLVVEENSTDDTILADCLKDKVKNIKFPITDIVKEYKVKFPFVFQK